MNGSTMTVAFLLASRYIKRANIWATLLVVAVMMITFLNLVMVTGVLVGLIAGAENAYRSQYSGDILVDTYPGDRFIERTPMVIRSLESVEGVRAVSPRFTTSGSIEANYQRAVNQPNTEPDTAGGTFAGIDPEREKYVTTVNDAIVEGEFLTSRDEGYVVIGRNLIARYLPGDFGFATIEDTYPGDKLRVTVNGVTREMIVKGILKGKADAVDSRVFFVDRELQGLMQRTDYNVGEIAVVIDDGADVDVVKKRIEQTGITQYARVRKSGEAIGSFLEDIKTTFATLGNVIGATSLVVASITVFIVIFITAITRRKYIGILKGIGITSATIELSYIMLSLFYAVIGVGIGLLLLYFVMVPYFAENPIDFPFSDGILVVTPVGTIVRVILLFITTIIAGYIPAKIVVSKNALESIRGN